MSFRSRSIQLSLGLAASLISIKAVDLLTQRYAPRLPHQPQPESFEKNILTLDLYPYTGWHVPSNFLHQGPMPWEQRGSSDFTIKSGPMGFFTDFDIRNPPKKTADEFRIILIGGSGAQGWGAQTNEQMLYKQLEKNLNERIGNDSSRVRVINMAMAGSITYQNFIALNRWAHPLGPDLILSYSGVNDVRMPLDEGMTDGFVHFTELNSMVIAAQGVEWPRSLKWLKSLFPSLMCRTRIGIALKALFAPSYFLDKARMTYQTNGAFDTSSKAAFFEKTVSPMYLDALRSIKRDFMGVPIMIAWQAYPSSTDNEKDLGSGYYDKMFEDTRRGLTGYINDDWYFINVHKIFEDDPKDYIDVHLRNEGHKIVADILAEQIIKIIRKRKGVK